MKELDRMLMKWGLRSTVTEKLVLIESASKTYAVIIRNKKGQFTVDLCGITDPEDLLIVILEFSLSIDPV